MARKKGNNDVASMDIDELFARKKQIDAQLAEIKNMQNEIIAEAVLRDLRVACKSRSMDVSQINREMIADWANSFAGFLSSDEVRQTGNMRTKMRQINQLKAKIKQLKTEIDALKKTNDVPDTSVRHTLGLATVHSNLPTQPANRR